MSKIRLTGSNSGYVEIASAADAGNLTFVLPTSGTSLIGNGNNVFTGITTFTNDFKLEGGSYDVLWDASDNQLEFDDNAKLSFGASSDLQIYHDGNHNIFNASNGFVKFNNNVFQVYNQGGNNISFEVVPGSYTKLFHGTSNKLQTTNTGVVVSGIMTATEINYTGGQNLSNRNLIINGAMNVAQRGTSSTVNGYGSVDRFRPYFQGNDNAITQAQVDVASGTTPYTLGFRKAFKLTNGNQTGGAGANDAIQIQTSLEAQDLANCGWNYTSSSSFVTLSFWIKSSVAQNFYCFLRTNDGTEQRYTFETGSLSVDTWTKITKTIPGNSNIQFDNNNGNGLTIFFVAFYGTDFTDSGVTLNQWATYASGTRMPDYTSTWYTTNNATLELTGVQLEIGSVATPFEHRSFHDDYLRCCRYYFGGDNTYTSGSVYYGSVYSSGNTMIRVPHPVPMRTTPTASQPSQGGGGSFSQVYENSMITQYYYTGDTSVNVPVAQVDISAEL